MSYQARAGEVGAVLSANPSLGVVHSRIRLVNDWGKFIQHFKTAAGRIDGWEITRRSGGEEEGRWVETYVLRRYFGIDDSDATDLLFQESLDEAARRFRDATLTFGIVPGELRIEETQERVFGGVLCHYAECTLAVSMDLDAL